MIDDKKIEKAAFEYAMDNWLSDDCVVAYEDGFVKGINWFKESLWHKQDELPERGKKIMIEYNDGLCVAINDHLARSIIKDPYITVKRWLYIEDLMK